MPDRHAQLSFDGAEFELPVVEPTIGNPGVNIATFRNTSGAVTFDPGFANTAGARSSITYIDGSNGVLQHRGYSIEDLAANATFLEVAYLLLFKKLPTRTELDTWEDSVRHHTLLNEEMKRFFDAFPKSAHPMAILSSATNAISTFYEEFYDPTDEDMFHESALRLIAKMPTIAAWAYKKSTGMPYCYPRNDLDYVENFIHMMFHLPVQQEEIDPVLAKALNVLLILHADHEQNCSTATVRGVGSSQANLFASVSAGIDALWGPLHGGANQRVIEMLRSIVDDPNASAKSMIERAKDPNDPFRLMGFGHRVYKNYDPRAHASFAATPMRSSGRWASPIHCSMSRRNSSRQPWRTTTSPSASSIQTSTSTRASSSEPSSSRPGCSRCCLRSGVCPGGWRSGRR